MPEETVTAADMAACDCEPCKRKDGLANSVRAGRIHSYTSQPRNGWRPRYTARETERVAEGVAIPTFGIELETAAPQVVYTNLPDRPVLPFLPYNATPDQRAEYERVVRDRNRWDERNAAHRRRQAERQNARGHIRADEAVSLASPRGFWHAKHDGSVTGPEFASQPASLAYWRAQRAHLAGMLRSLLHGGMRSHDGDTCGLHINIGTRSFDNAEHLARFAKLVYVNPRWSTRMSQRTHSSVQHWARFDELTDDASRQRWAEEVFRYGYASRSRYIVLNASNEGRIEFRLPRGTLRFDRFMAKLEWVAAMVEYTRDGSNVVQVSPFMRWVQRTGEYPALLTYMQERFDAARFAEPETPEPAPAPVVREPEYPVPVVREPEFVPLRCDALYAGRRCEFRFGHNGLHQWEPADDPFEPVSPDPLRTVSLFEPLVPYEGRCHAMQFPRDSIGYGGGYVCTRAEGHTGNHAATDIAERTEWAPSAATVAPEYA